MIIRTNSQLATIVVMRQNADEQNVRNGHTLPLHGLPLDARRNWQTRVHIALRELGFDRDKRTSRLNFLSEIFGRELTSVNDLSWPECQIFCAAVSLHITRQDLEKMANEYR